MHKTMFENNSCAVCGIPLDAEYFDVSGFVGIPLIEDTNSLLAKILREEISNVIAASVGQDALGKIVKTLQDEVSRMIVTSLKNDVGSAIVKTLKDDVGAVIVKALKDEVRYPIVQTLKEDVGEAIVKKLDETAYKAATKTTAKKTAKPSSEPSSSSPSEFVQEPSAPSSAEDMPPSTPESTLVSPVPQSSAPPGTDSLPPSAPEATSIATAPPSPTTAVPSPAWIDLFADFKIRFEELPRRGEQKVLASFQLHPQYCGILTYFAQYTDLYARNNSQIFSPGFEWIILQNGKPLFPYTRLEFIINPWGNNCLPVAVRLDENARVEFVIRNRSINDADLQAVFDPVTGKLLTAPKYPIRAFAGRIMGRYWYNESFGGRARSWHE